MLTFLFFLVLKKQKSYVQTFDDREQIQKK